LLKLILKNAQNCIKKNKNHFIYPLKFKDFLLRKNLNNINKKKHANFN